MKYNASGHIICCLIFSGLASGVCLEVLRPALGSGLIITYLLGICLCFVLHTLKFFRKYFLCRNLVCQSTVGILNTLAIKSVCLEGGGKV